MSRRYRKIAAASAVALLLGGGALAVVRSTSGRSAHHRASPKLAHGVRASLARPIDAYLGISAATLHRELQSGRTLAQIARSRGRSEARLIDVIVAARRRTLETVARDRKVGRAREEKLLAHLKQRVRRFVRRSLASRPLR
jgi:hypothetical protein